MANLRLFIRDNPGIFDIIKQEKPKASDAKNKSIERQSIIQRSRIEWPDDFEMQEYYIQNQVNAMKQIENLPSMYKNKNLVEIVINKVRRQWPDDYEMQLYTARQQMEAYQRIK